MNFTLHPWLGEARLILRRRTRPIAVWCVLSLSVLCVLALSPHVLHALAWRPWITAALLAVLTYVLVRPRFADTADAWRYGWWSAIPINARVIPSTVVVMAVTAIVAIAVIGVLLWWPWLWLSADHHLARIALSACVAGAIAGVSLAAGVVVTRPNQDVDKAQRQPTRTALFGFRWLHDKRLPYLLEWQRRAALVRWRSGRRSWWLAGFFAALPGMPALEGIGLLLMTMAAAWLIAVLDAAAGMSAAAVELLAATPQPVRTLRSGLLRYVLFALLCSVLVATVGACAVMSPLALLLWGVFVVLASSHSLWRMAAALNSDSQT